MRESNPASKILIIWGDSHADHAVGAVEAADNDQRFALLPRWMSGCPPLLGVVPLDSRRPQAQKDCLLFNNAVMAEIGQLRREGRLAGVVLAARWSMYLDRPSLVREAGRALWQDGRLMEGDSAVIALMDGLRSTLNALQGLKILVVAPMPEQRFEVPPCLVRRSLEYCSISRRIAEESRSLALRAVRQAIGDASAAQLWDPLPALCDEGHCPAERDGIIMYLDDEHLTYAGSRQLGPSLQESTAWKAVLSEDKPIASDPSHNQGQRPIVYQMPR
jgi:hypothetical protein